VSPLIRLLVNGVVFVGCLLALGFFVKPDLGGFLLGGAIFVVLMAAADRLLLPPKPPVDRRPGAE
jgi:hypothetical protein